MKDEESMASEADENEVEGIQVTDEVEDDSMNDVDKYIELKYENEANDQENSGEDAAALTNNEVFTEPKEGDDSEGEQYDSEDYLIPPSACYNEHSTLSYGVYPCPFCGGNGLLSDQDESAYADTDTDNDEPLEEDDKHFDSEGRVEMLFEPLEPGILLACKEIRSQCLGVYYAENAFLWRFFWQQSRRSLLRFITWTQVVRNNTKYIRRISFEGRHAVEEGIEFEVDIDLLNQRPFYKVQVDYLHSQDGILDVVVEAVEQDFLALLFRMSKYSENGVIKLNAARLELLGGVFWEALKRGPGIVGGQGQWDDEPGVV